LGWERAGMVSQVVQTVLNIMLEEKDMVQWYVLILWDFLVTPSD
jgi:hypothetical protein